MLDHAFLKMVWAGCATLLLSCGGSGGQTGDLVTCGEAVVSACGEVEEGGECDAESQCLPGLKCVLGVCCPSGPCAAECGDSGLGCDVDVADTERGWSDGVDSLSSALTWQVQPSPTKLAWPEAKEYCQGLDSGGTGWRLPTVGELRTLVVGCNASEIGGTCNVQDGKCLSWSCRDDACNGCAYMGGSADGCYWSEEVQGQCGEYWSVSELEDLGNGWPWHINFSNGMINFGYGSESYNVRCVK